MSAAVQPKATFYLGYRPELDGLRAVSILIVMLGHANYLYAGFVGVDVFFTLSGFLITALLMQEFNKTGRISIKSFYIRRALRLLPALFAVLLCVGVCALIFNRAIYFKYILACLFYVANWFAMGSPDELGPLSHVWSLSVEEQFYLIFPPLFYFALRRKVRGLPTILFALIFISAALKPMLFHYGAERPRLYFGLDTRADAILIGCLIAVLAVKRKIPQLLIRACRLFIVPSIVLIVAISVIFTLQARFLARDITTIVGALAGVIIIGTLDNPFPPLRWLAPIGRISYGLYLWHYLVFWIIPAHWSQPVIAITGIALSFTVAIASYFLIERPFLKMKLLAASCEVSRG
jgi:peptidoglycan/LPS O-acetylase OafA/YrhL